MTKIEKFTSTNTLAIESKIRSAMDAIAEEYGIQIEMAGLRYNGELFRISKIEGKTSARTAQVQAVQQTQGYLKVGTIFQVKDSVFTIVSVNPHRPKNLYSVVTERGAKYRCPAAFVASGRIIKQVA